MDLYKAEVRTLQVENLKMKSSCLGFFYFKEFIRVLRINNPTISRVFERVENDEILRLGRNKIYSEEIFCF